MSHGSLTDAVNASGQRPVHRVVHRLDAVEAVLHRPRPGGLRVGDDLLAGGAVEPGVVQDPVVAGVAPGEDRRVVGERHRRQPAIAPHSYAVPIVDQPGDVGCLAGGGHARRARWGSRRRTGSRRRAAGVRRRRRARRRAPRRPGPRGGGRRRRARTPSSSAIVGATSTSRADARHQAVVAHALARRSRTVPGPARPRATRARRGGRPGPPSCGRPSASRTGRARPGGRTAGRSARRRTGRRWSPGRDAGRRSSAASPTRRSGDWSASGSVARRPSMHRRSRPVAARRKRDRAVGAGRLVAVVGPCDASTMSTIGDSAGSSSTSSARSRSLTAGNATHYPARPKLRHSTRCRAAGDATFEDRG